MRLTKFLDSQKRVLRSRAKITYNILPKITSQSGEAIAQIVRRIQKDGGHRPILPAVNTLLTTVLRILLVRLRWILFTNYKYHITSRISHITVWSKPIFDKHDIHTYNALFHFCRVQNLQECISLFTGVHNWWTRRHHNHPSEYDVKRQHCRAVTIIRCHKGVLGYVHWPACLSMITSRL